MFREPKPREYSQEMVKSRRAFTQRLRMQDIFQSAPLPDPPPLFDFFPEPWTAAPPDTAENQSTAVTDVNPPRSDM